MTKIVYIEGGDGAYANMWRNWGWTITANPLDADVIQFTGGEDVNPALYGEAVHPKTHYNERRDVSCANLYKLGVANGIKLAGICRGGQFLNVMNGGSMFQHCDGHGIYGVHKATILASGLEVDVTSTHHQIMRPNRKDGIVLMEANKLGTFKEHMEYFLDEVHGGKDWDLVSSPWEDDVEAVFYPDTMSLCFQPHPEFVDRNHSCQQAYIYCLRNHLELDI